MVSVYMIIYGVWWCMVYAMYPTFNLEIFQQNHSSKRSGAERRNLSWRGAGSRKLENDWSKSCLHWVPPTVAQWRCARYGPGIRSSLTNDPWSAFRSSNVWELFGSGSWPRRDGPWLLNGSLSVVVMRHHIHNPLILLGRYPPGN